MIKYRLKGRWPTWAGKEPDIGGSREVPRRELLTDQRGPFWKQFDKQSHDRSEYTKELIIGADYRGSEQKKFRKWNSEFSLGVIKACSQVQSGSRIFSFFSWFTLLFKHTLRKRFEFPSRRLKENSNNKKHEWPDIVIFMTIKSWIFSLLLS